VKNNKRALSPKEVAICLSISRRTVYDLLKNEEIKSYKIGSHVKVDKEDLDQYIANQKKASHKTCQALKKSSNLPWNNK